jgi:tetratricopeptide (TPR) repeat protein
VVLMARMEPAGKPADAPRLVERVGAEASNASTAGASGKSGAAGQTATTAPGAASGWPTPAMMRVARAGEYRDAAVGLVRNLANPQSERSSQFRRYLTLLRGGAASDAAFEECFFGSFDALYTAAAQSPARGAPAIELEAPMAAVATARDLPWDRAVLAVGDLLVRAVPWNTVAAELHFRAVLEGHPDDATALRGIALARELDHRVEDAAELWTQSLAAAPDDRVTPMLDGWSRLDRFRLAVGTRRGWEDPLPEQVAAARELFARALAPDPAAPSSPHALHGFGATFLFARTGFDPGVAALERAARLLPGDDEIAADLVLLRAHAGDEDGAWELRRQRLLDRAAPDLDGQVEKLLAEEALHAANQLLLVDQKPTEAMALVRGAAAEVRNPDTRKQLQDVLGQMEQVATKLADSGLYERFIDDFKQAKTLAGQRRFAEARKLLEPYAAETVDPVVRDPARDALRQIDQVDHH